MREKKAGLRKRVETSRKKSEKTTLSPEKVKKSSSLLFEYSYNFDDNFSVFLKGTSKIKMSITPYHIKDGCNE